MFGTPVIFVPWWYKDVRWYTITITYYGTSKLFHMVANGCTMVRIQCIMVYHNVGPTMVQVYFVPCLHHGSTRMYHGTVTMYHGSTRMYHGTVTMYHGSTRMYHGTVTMYHGIPLFAVVYHGYIAPCLTMVLFHKGLKTRVQSMVPK